MTASSPCRRSHPAITAGSGRLTPAVIGALVLVLALPAANAAEPLNIWVSILPQAFLVERIGGDRVTVEVLVGPGQSPASFDPTARQMVALSQADAFFGIGVPMENGTLRRLRADNPDLPVFDTRPQAADGLGDLGSSPVASCGHNHDQGLDPHIWLSIPLVKESVTIVAETLARLDPGHASYFRANLQRLRDDLDRTDAEIREILAPVRGRELLVYHPAFGHFARQYGLHQVAIETGGQAPSPKHLTHVLDTAAENGIGAVFVQPQFSATLAAHFAKAAGLAVVELDPLARDHLANLKQMAVTIRNSLRAER